MFVSELCLVPKPGAVEEDDCWLLAYVNDAHAKQLRMVILDA